MGSKDYVMFLWILGSYPLGWFTLFLLLGVVHLLCYGLERWTMPLALTPPWRHWRGHFHPLYLMGYSAYNWGFFCYWMSTAVVMYVFNHHRDYVPPYTYLSTLGLLAGAVAAMWHTMFAPSHDNDLHQWIRSQSMEIKVFLQSCPWRADREGPLRVWDSHVAKYIDWQWCRWKHLSQLALNR